MLPLFGRSKKFHCGCGGWLLEDIAIPQLLKFIMIQGCHPGFSAGNPGSCGKISAIFSGSSPFF